MAWPRHRNALAPMRRSWVTGGLLGLLLCLQGCGKAAPEAPVSTVPNADRQTQLAPLDKPPPLQTWTALGPSAAAPAPLSQPPLIPSPSAPPRAGEAAPASVAAEQAAWREWYAAARESPDVSVRLQALEQWAQRPGDQLDPVTYGLVDEDDTVRARAQGLYEQHVQREATQGEGGGQAP